MLSAVYFHLSAVGSQGFPLGHVPNYSYDFEEPLMYALIFLVFLFNGAGPLSIDSIIYKSISPEDDIMNQWIYDTNEKVAVQCGEISSMLNPENRKNDPENRKKR